MGLMEALAAWLRKNYPGYTVIEGPKPEPQMVFFSKADDPSNFDYSFEDC